MRMNQGGNGRPHKGSLLYYMVFSFVEKCEWHGEIELLHDACMRRAAPFVLHKLPMNKIITPQLQLQTCSSCIPMHFLGKLHGLSDCHSTALF